MTDFVRCGRIEQDAWDLLSFLQHSGVGYRKAELDSFERDQTVRLNEHSLVARESYSMVENPEYATGAIVPFSNGPSIVVAVGDYRCVS
jgi:hypothetical protein